MKMMMRMMNTMRMMDRQATATANMMRLDRELPAQKATKQCLCPGWLVVYKSGRLKSGGPSGLFLNVYVYLEQVRMRAAL